jgi:hypothetical protein
MIFELWCHRKDNDHRLYGRVTATAQAILDNIRKPFDVIKKQGKHYGFLTFEKFDIIEYPSMLDYLRSGWAVSLSVAVDFTASNGKLNEPGTLHYIDPNDLSKMTPYEQAILQVGKILEPYDHNRQFPVFGYGAIPRYMGIDDISHCFNLNGQANPEVYGVEGILKAYRDAIYGGIELYGPTNFSP